MIYTKLINFVTNYMYIVIIYELPVKEEKGSLI